MKISFYQEVFLTLLNIYVKEDKIHGVLVLSILEDISSYTWESFVFKDWTILLISLVKVGLRCSEVVSFKILELRFRIGSWVKLLPEGSWVKFWATEEKKELKELAIISGWCVRWLLTHCGQLRLYITTVQDGWRKSAFLTRACFPCTIHLIMQYMEHFSEWSCWWMFIQGLEL